MSKKVISILLSAAMLVAMLCVGVGAVTASADDTVTYYFLAPDEYFATNDSVGYYYWAPTENGPWPGLEMTPAPEIGENVYKCECPDMDSTSTIIFNAFVDAGTPADPELAANAHQTININTEGYVEGESAVYDELGMELDDFYGMIYVLDNNQKSINDFSGAATTAGEWFSVDPSAPNYYKNYEQYYGSYGFSDVTTDSEPADTDTETTPVATDYHAGDIITIDITLQDVAYIGSFVGELRFNADLLGHEIGDYTLPSLAGTPVVNDEQNPDEGMVGKFRFPIAYAPNGEKEYFAGEPKSAISFKFTVNADCNYEDLNLEYFTEEIIAVNAKSNDNYDATQGMYITVFENAAFDADKAATDTYAKMNLYVECNHTVSTDTDTPVVSDTDTTKPVTSDTDTTAPVTSDTDTTKPVESDTDTTAPVTSDTDKTSDKDSDTSSDKKNTNDTASRTSSTTSKTTSTKTTTTTSTVQTAGTFAVVSLVVILMAAAAVVLYTRKKTEE